MKKTVHMLLPALLLCLCSTVSLADIVAVVSANSPVTALSPEQIADIFLGRSARFPDGSAAVPLDQPEGSAARSAFYERYAAKSPVEMKQHWSKLIFTGRGQPPRQVGDAAAVKAALAQQPNAISYLDRSLVDGTLTILE
jgi:ABC-type phosphate transport system substrate-binding protein